MLRQTFEKEETMKMKLEISNELKLHLKQMKEALAGTSFHEINKLKKINRRYHVKVIRVQGRHF